jgi:hypothetical protein
MVLWFSSVVHGIVEILKATKNICTMLFKMLPAPFIDGHEPLLFRALLL